MIAVSIGAYSPKKRAHRSAHTDDPPPRGWGGSIRKVWGLRGFRGDIWGIRKEKTIRSPPKAAALPVSKCIHAHALVVWSIRTAQKPKDAS